MATKHTISQMKYDKQNRRVYGLRLHNDIDRDIIDKLASVPSMQGYIKQLIRDDIQRNKPHLYKVKPEYLATWGRGITADTVLTEEDLQRIVNSWEKVPDDIMYQLVIVKE